MLVNVNVPVIPITVIAFTSYATQLGLGNESIPIKLIQHYLSNESNISIIFEIGVVIVLWIIFLLTKYSKKCKCFRVIKNEQIGEHILE